MKANAVSACLKQKKCCIVNIGLSSRPWIVFIKAGLLTCSQRLAPSQAFGAQWHVVRAKQQMELTAAGLSGIFTPFPFNCVDAQGIRANLDAAKLVKKSVTEYFRAVFCEKKVLFSFHHLSVDGYALRIDMQSLVGA